MRMLNPYTYVIHNTTLSCFLMRCKLRFNIVKKKWLVSIELYKKSIIISVNKINVLNNHRKIIFLRWQIAHMCLYKLIDK